MSDDDSEYIPFSFEIKTAGTPKSVDVLVASVINLMSLTRASQEFLTVTFPLVLDELLRNAIFHGNKADPAKSVSICVSVCGSLLDLEIVDEGSGYDYKESALSNYRVDSYDGSGRGLQIVRSYCKKVVVSGEGNNISVQMLID